MQLYLLLWQIAGKPRAIQSKWYEALSFAKSINSYASTVVIIRNGMVLYRGGTVGRCVDFKRSPLCSVVQKNSGA